MTTLEHIFCRTFCTPCRARGGKHRPPPCPRCIALAGRKAALLLGTRLHELALDFGDAPAWLSLTIDDEGPPDDRIVVELARHLEQAAALARKLIDFAGVDSLPALTGETITRRTA